MSKIFGLFFSLFFLAGVFALSAAVFWYNVPAPGTLQEVEYEVKEGTSLRKVSDDLNKLGIIRWPYLFRGYARLRNAHPIKAGPYRFEANITPSEVLQKLIKGSVVTVSFTIQEGWNTWQVSEKLAETFPSISAETWFEATRDPRYRSKLPKEAPTLEGYLFPDTYHIRKMPLIPEVLNAMMDNFHKNFSSDILERGKALNLTPDQIVTLASIIEKETGHSRERTLISAVFHNRLKLGMRLQTDPTVIYGLFPHFDGNLRKKDLQTPNPYNTYTNYGLPPGPISNPGKESLLAAVDPAPVDYIFFVSKGDGTSSYSTTLKDHNKAVHQYQILPYRRQKKK